MEDEQPSLSAADARDHMGKLAYAVRASAVSGMTSRRTAGGHEAKLSSGYWPRVNDGSVRTLYFSAQTFTPTWAPSSLTRLSIDSIHPPNVSSLFNKMAHSCDQSFSGPCQMSRSDFPYHGPHLYQIRTPHLSRVSYGAHLRPHMMMEMDGSILHSICVW